MIRLEKRGRRIVITSNEMLTGLQTTIPGAYQSVSGAWTVPLSIETCKLLREKYGKRLQVGNELRRWVAGVRASRKSMLELSKQTDAKLFNVRRQAPRLAKAMNARPYQRVGARFIADNPATLLADDPGLGKTLICMAGILESGVPGPYLVIAPKTASESVWRREITRWLPRHHIAVTVPDFRHKRERVFRRAVYGESTWVIVHPEMVQVQEWLICAVCKEKTPASTKQRTELKCKHVKDSTTKREFIAAYAELFSREWGAIIIDESHESLIRRSSKLTQRRRGMEMLQLRPDGIKLAMSGTPMDSKPHQLWGTLNWLDPVQYSAFHRWAELYWQKGGFTGHEIGEFRKDREALLWDSLAAISLRRTKSEVAADLPAKTEVGTPLVADDPDSPIGVWLEMEGEQAKAYEEMAELSVTQLKSGRLEATTALAELTRLKQLACSYGDIYPVHKGGELRYQYAPTLPSNKYQWIVDHLEEWGYPHEPLTKIVVVSFYTGILTLFAENIERHFRTKPGARLTTAITGRTPIKDRAKIIEQFNSPGGPQIMFLNVKAGGTAITIDTADKMIFVSETRIPDQQLQAEDRIHRVSNPRKVEYYYLRSLGTVDIGTAIVNKELREGTHRLLDQRRGVDYVRQVMNLSK